MDKISNLLQQVSIIQKKYDDLAEYSGEHYNVFDILGVRSDELSHSTILTNLLDAKGKHGQKDIFLKLFIEQIHPLLEKSRYSEYINSFDTENATAKKEISIGGVKYDTAEGGRVDIVVGSSHKHLVIENKIYAGDQDQQLLRYNNHYKNDPIIYLTLNGDEPSKASKGDLVLGTDFICISYHTDLSNWLEKCIKEMANKPIIRETLNQYLFLIKSLTNQSNNNKMSEEIVKTMRLNIKSSFEISNNINELRKSLFSSFIEKFINMFSTEIEIKVDSEIWRKDKSIHIKNKKWENLNIEIYFLGENFTNICIGLIPSLRGTKLDEQFKNKISVFLSNLNFGKNQNNGGWYFFQSFNVFANTNKAEFWENINGDEFVNKVFEDVNLLLNSIDEEYKKQYE
jgi:hypothetical protein